MAIPQRVDPKDTPDIRSAHLGGLDALIGKLRSLENPPTLSEISSLLAEAAISEDDIAKYRNFTAEKYTRKRVFRNKFAELLVICWMPVQESFIHDHDGSHGTVRVFEGEMVEVRYRWDDGNVLCTDSVQEVAPPAMAGVSEPDIHKLGNSSFTENAVTIHLYAPPLTGLNIYEVGSGGSRFLACD